jgi:hypothetical protein
MKKPIAAELIGLDAQSGIRKNLIVVARSNVARVRWVEITGDYLIRSIEQKIRAPVGRHLGRDKQDCSGRPWNGVAIWCAPHQNNYENVTSTKLLDPNNNRIGAGRERLPRSRRRQSHADSGHVQRTFGKHFTSSYDVAA